jgi:hypothetical protein
MARSKPDNIRSNSPISLPTCSLSTQYIRQRCSSRYPQGFERYVASKALLDDMPVLGGADDQYGANPDRYRTLEK